MPNQLVTERQVRRPLRARRHSPKAFREKYGSGVAKFKLTKDTVLVVPADPKNPNGLPVRLGYMLHHDAKHETLRMNVRLFRPAPIRAYRFDDSIGDHVDCILALDDGGRSTVIYPF